MPSLADIEVSPKKGYSLLSISKGRSLEDIDKPKGRSLADIDSSGTSLADAKAQIYALSPATQKPSNLSDTYTPSPNPQQITAKPTLDPAAIQTAMARVQAGAPPLGQEQLYAQSPIMQALHKPLARPEPSGPVIGPATGKEKPGPAGELPSQRYFSEEMRRQRIPEQYQQQIDQRSLGHEFSAGGVRGIASMLAGANANLAAAATEVGLDKLAQNRMKAAEKIRYFMSQPKYAATRPDVGQIANPRDALHWIAGGAGQMMPLALAAYSATVAGGPGAGATFMAGAETGDIYQEVYEKDKGRKGATVAAVHGVAAGLLDYIPVLRIFNKMGVDDTVKREAKRHILRRVPKEIIKQAATEGLTEGAQTVIEQAALEWVDKNHKLFSDENIREVINATAMGIAVGGLTGGAAAPFMGGQTSSEKGVTPNAVENPPATQLYGDVGQQAGPSQAQIVGPQTSPQVNRVGIPQGGQEAQVQEAVTPPPPVQEPLPATAGAQAGAKQPWEMTKDEFEQQFPEQAAPKEYDASSVTEDVYHGSEANSIEQFYTEAEQTGGNTGASTAKLGAFFSEDPSIASTASFGFNPIGIFGKNTKTLYKAKLNLKNPLQLDSLSESDIAKIESLLPGFTKTLNKHKDGDKFSVLKWLSEQKNPRTTTGKTNFYDYGKKHGLSDTEIEQQFANKQGNEYSDWEKQPESTGGEFIGKDILKSLGYDGIIVNTLVDSGELLGPKKQYVVFDPKNIYITKRSPVVGHDTEVKVAVQMGRDVPINVLQEYAGEAWAPALTKELPAGPQKITEFSAKHRQSGQTALLTDVAEEISASAKRSVESTWESAKSAKNIAKRIVLRGTRWMETLGPSGRRISDEIKQVDQRASKRSKNQQWDTRNLLKNFSKKQRERIARLAEKAEPRTQGPLQDAADKLTVILDKDMFEAKAVDLKRKGKPIAGSGHPFPQIPNEAGKKWLDKVERKGMADPEVAKTVNDMVETGQAPDTDAAILRLREYRNNLLRGVNPYFERERTITLPIKYREWDPVKVLPTLFERNALTIEGVRQWGNEHERLAPLLEAVGQESGDRANAHIIDSYMKQNFDVGGMISKEDQALAGAMSNYQTLTRLGGSLLSAIRNMGQRMTNTVRYPIGIQLKAIKDYPPIANKFMKSAERIKERMERTGAIRTATVLSEIENTAPGHRITNLSMKAFKEVETGNQIHSAIVAGYGLEKDLELYAALSNKSRIRQIMDMVLSFGDKSPSAIKRRLRTSQLSNMSDEQMANLLAKQNNTMTMGQLEEALSRFVSDTQFPQTLATKRIWWDSHPWMRLMAKFKTFGIEQTGMIYRHVVQEAAKGNFAPMMRFVIWTALMGELYNILRDWITGREESVTSQIRNDAEVKQIVWHIAKNFADGGGIGMLADLVWGIGDYLGGPVYSTLKNGKRATGDIIRDPSAHQVVMSIRDFFSREVSVSKQVSGIINHIDQQINQDNNTYFGYQKWRQRAIDYQKKKKDGISDKVAGIIEGHPQYERTERTNKYEYAANQITAGDIDDAVDYLVMVMKNAETDDDKRNIIKGIKLSMKAKSPLGSVAEKDQSEFLSKYSPNEKKEAISYNQKWIKRYEEAMIKAEKQAWGGAIKQSGKKTKRRGTRALPKRIR
jgi:hypothetical protein